MTANKPKMSWLTAKRGRTNDLYFIYERAFKFIAIGLRIFDLIQTYYVLHSPVVYCGLADKRFNTVSSSLNGFVDVKTRLSRTDPLRKLVLFIVVINKCLSCTFLRQRYIHIMLIKCCTRLLQCQWTNEITDFKVSFSIHYLLHYFMCGFLFRWSSH